MRSGWAATVVGFVLLVACVGCGGSGTPAKGSSSEVKKVGIAFMRYVGSHQGKAPASREEFDKFLSELTPGQLEGMGITDKSTIFKSSRDNEELVVRYGITVPPPGKDPTVVVYEKKGVGGKHFVAYGTAGVEEIDEKRLKELVPDAK